MIKKLAWAYSTRARRTRAALFWKHLRPTEDDRILDLGSGDGAHIASVIPFRENVYIADISEAKLAKGRHTYGFKTTLLHQSGHLPFPDKFFDIVFCSSVIEHVTVDKEDVWHFRTAVEFSRAAYAGQRRFANEIRRISSRYFVQTPNKYFPIESHTWLPFLFVFIPRRHQIKLIGLMSKWWPKNTSPDWNLLARSQMQKLFPEAEIVVERSFGFVKSIMAIKC